MRQLHSALAAHGIVTWARNLRGERPRERVMGVVRLNTLDWLVVAFVLIAFVALQWLRLHPKETLGEVKDRLQREVMTNGVAAPKPLSGRVAINQLLTA